jgi:hypothetical protein
MPLGIAGDRILFDDESKQCTTPASVQCHCNSRGDRIRSGDLLNPIQEAPQPIPLPNKADAPNSCTACTSACTNEATITHGGIVEALGMLSTDDRARLAALLLGEQREGTDR